MPQSKESHYNLRVEIDGAKESKAVAAQITEVIAEMAEAAWDTEIAEGEAAYAADDSADRDSGAATGHVKILSAELDELCRSVRTIGKSRFKLTDPVLWQRGATNNGKVLILRFHHPLRREERRGADVLQRQVLGERRCRASRQTAFGGRSSAGSDDRLPGEVREVRRVRAD